MARLRLIRTPLKYVQGKGALLSFHDELSYLGKRWLFVCSNSGHRTCHDSIEKSFGNSDDLRIYEVFGGISSNGEIARMQEIVRNEKIDVVVGVGGGSAIDTAKAVAHYEKLPVAVVPTVISTLLSLLCIRSNQKARRTANISIPMKSLLLRQRSLRTTPSTPFSAIRVLVKWTQSSCGQLLWSQRTVFFSR